jgi:hypothetical protein
VVEAVERLAMAERASTAAETAELARLAEVLDRPIPAAEVVEVVMRHLEPVRPAVLA